MTGARDRPLSGERLLLPCEPTSPLLIAVQRASDGRLSSSYLVLANSISGRGEVRRQDPASSDGHEAASGRPQADLPDGGHWSGSDGKHLDLFRGARHRDLVLIRSVGDALRTDHLDVVDAKEAENGLEVGREVIVRRKWPLRIDAA